MKQSDNKVTIVTIQDSLFLLSL